MLFAAFTLQSAVGQPQTTVFGNLGMENVNISIVNTQYGTSTDVKGYYFLLSMPEKNTYISPCSCWHFDRREGD